jgi:hypothetical protein
MLNDLTLIIGVNMNANVSIKTHVAYDKLLNLMDSKQNSDRMTYLKSGQNVKTIFLKLETQ